MQKRLPTAHFKVGYYDSDILLGLALLILSVSIGSLLSYDAVFMCLDVWPILGYKIHNYAMLAMLFGTIGSISYRYWLWDKCSMQRNLLNLGTVCDVGMCLAWLLLWQKYGRSFAVIFGISISFSIGLTYWFIMEIMHRLYQHYFATAMAVIGVGFSLGHSICTAQSVELIRKYNMLTYQGWWSIIVVASVSIAVAIFYKLDLDAIAKSKHTNSDTSTQDNLIQQTIQKVQNSTAQPEELITYPLPEILKAQSKYNYYRSILPLCLACFSVGALFYQMPIVLARITLISFVDVAKILAVTLMGGSLVSVAWCYVGERSQQRWIILLNLGISGAIFYLLSGHFHTIMMIKVLLICLAGSYSAIFYLTLSELRSKFTADNYQKLLLVSMIIMLVISGIGAKFLQTRTPLASDYLRLFQGYAIILCIGTIILASWKYWQPLLRKSLRKRA